MCRASRGSWFPPTYPQFPISNGNKETLCGCYLYMAGSQSQDHKNMEDLGCSTQASRRRVDGNG